MRVNRSLRAKQQQAAALRCWQVYSQAEVERSVTCASITLQCERNGLAQGKLHMEVSAYNTMQADVQCSASTEQYRWKGKATRVQCRETEVTRVV